jgi:hypothetical protein
VKAEILYSKNGREYSTRELYDVLSAEEVALEMEERKIPEPSALKTNSLSGVIDFLEQHEPDEFSVKPEVIHIQDYNAVSAKSKLLKSSQRIEFCFAKALGIENSEFKFGQFYDQEYMVIALQSLFVRTPTVEALLKVIGKTMDVTAAELTDDGYSQSVAVKSGVASAAEVQLPNPVVLQPYRTFLEIEQPESIFIVRTRKGAKGAPEFSLFLADGGLWKLRAIASIKEFFKKEGVGLPIIG